MFRTVESDAGVKHTQRDHVLYCTTGAGLALALLPSILCVVRDRNTVTEIVTGSYACLAAGWAVAHNGPAHVAPFVLQMVSTQVLWSVALYAAQRNTSLHYRGAVRAVAYVLNFAHVCIQIVYDTRTRHVDHWLVLGLFAGEVAGFAALVWVYFSRAMGLAYERALSK